MTVLRYIATAWSNAASAARFLCNSVPASKTVCATLPATVQNAVPGVRNNCLIWLATVPPSAVSVNCGSIAATATPIEALAACSCASADCMSGRCSTNFDARLTGRSVGSCNAASSNVSAGSWLGNRPVSAVSRSRCTANCFRNGGNVASACAKVASTAATSAPATCPSSNCLRRMPSDWVWILMISSVAAICPRTEASSTAAATLRQLLFVDAFGPSIGRLERHIEFRIEKAGGIGPVIRPPELRDDRHDFGEAADDLAHAVDVRGRFFQRDRRRQGSADPQIAFLEMGQKFEPECPHANHRKRHENRGAAEGHHPVGYREVKDRFVDAAQAAHDQRFGLAQPFRQ